MSTNNTKSGNAFNGIGLVGLWTILVTVLHYAGLGELKEWPVIAWPWQWSCLAFAEWYVILILLITLVVAITYIFSTVKLKRKTRDIDRRIEVQKLLSAKRIDEAKSLAERVWPNGIPDVIKNAIDSAEAELNSKSDSIER